MVSKSGWLFVIFGNINYLCHYNSKKLLYMALNPEFEQVGRDIIGACFNVRKETGRGLREKYYEAALAWEISKSGHFVERQKTIPCIYKGVEIDNAYTCDIIVDDHVIIEVKALGQMLENEFRQLLTYMRLSGIKLGYLVNFGAKDFCMGRLDDSIPYKKGIYRLVNNI